MEIEKIRYHFEHKLLPSLYFQEDNKIILALIQDDGHLLYDIQARVFQTCESEMPYHASQYHCHPYSIDEHLKMLALTMPEPETTTLCASIFLVFDDAVTKKCYFTVERSIKGVNLLCGWDEEQRHVNYGECPDDVLQLVEKLSRIWIETL